MAESAAVSAAASVAESVEASVEASVAVMEAASVAESAEESEEESAEESEEASEEDTEVASGEDTEAVTDPEAASPRATVPQENQAHTKSTFIDHDSQRPYQGFVIILHILHVMERILADRVVSNRKRIVGDGPLSSFINRALCI